VIEFLKCEDAATSTEYAINVALVVTVIVSSVSDLTKRTKETFYHVSKSIEDTTGS
jgi:Flp pilus assembly pilin Flp